MKISDFFRLAYISIIEDCSIKTKDGNGLKLNLKKTPINNIFGNYKAKCELMIKDIEVSNYNKKVVLLNGSILKDYYFNQIKKRKSVYQSFPHHMLTALITAKFIN